MGVYDIVCGVQVKCTPEQMLKDYEIGDFIQLEDGVYIGYEGWFSVRNSKVIENGLNVYDKWGNLLSLEKLMANNPILEAIKDLKEATPNEQY